MRSLLRISAPLVSLVFALSAGAAAPTADLHEAKWFVHTDLVTGGMDIPFYEAIIDDALEEARVLIEGLQGPADRVCCSRSVKEEHSPGVTLTTFGSPGDGLDVVGTGEFATISGLGGSGSRAFLVDSITDCGGLPAIGCATLATCDLTPDDDPTLTMIVTMEAQDSGTLGLVVAHERGHNVCLVHVAANECELMRASVAGGCLGETECDHYTAGRTTTGGSCVCHRDLAAPTAAPDSLPCTDGPISGQCSGGFCGSTPGDAGVQLLGSSAPLPDGGAAKDGALLVSALTGGWTDLGSYSGEIKGLAHDPDTGVSYGVQDAAGDDLLVTVDATGAVTSTVGTITGHAEVVALAWDPGATAGSGDDRLLALSSVGGFEDLIELSPSTGAPTFVGCLSVGVSGGFQGLAYDSVNDALYASGFAGGSLWKIDESTCLSNCSSFCSTTEVTAVDLPRIDSGLAYSRDSGRLYLVGTQTGSRLFYDTIDATTFVAATTLGLDGFTPGGIGAIPLPEPGEALGLVAGAGLVALLARRRRP